MSGPRSQHEFTKRKPWSQSFLRWAGSKRKLVPRLLSLIPDDHGRYIEPFVGSACLFFALRPGEAVLGDINEELLDTYDTVRDHPRLVARKAHDWHNTKRQYYAVRRINPSKLSRVDRAARFVYLNRFCFNGVYRTNRNGHFNVPRGIRTGTMPNEQAIYRCAVALRCADLRRGDFESCVADVTSGDFVYLDPPYALVGRRGYGEYGYGCFGENDIERLVECLNIIHDVGATFLLSYSDTPRLKRLIRDWHSITVNVRRHVAGFARHRAKVSEILVSNKRLDGGGDG